MDKEKIVRKANKDRIKRRLSSGNNDMLINWSDYQWQMKYSVRSIEVFEHITGIKFGEEKSKIEETLRKFPLSITPYYASLIDTKNYQNDPVFKQAFPDVRELDVMKNDLVDPLSEDKDSPILGITHRYPDRVLLNVTNACSMYCRHCTRKRTVGDKDSFLKKKDIIEAIKYHYCLVV